MCPREGGGKGPQRRNCCEDVKQWVPTLFFSFNFWNNNCIKVMHFVVLMLRNPFLMLLPPLGFKLLIISFKYLVLNIVN
jgi:hypothetical protein